MFEKYIFISLAGDNPFPIVADWNARNGADYDLPYAPYPILDSTENPWEKRVLDEIDSRVTRDTNVLVHIMPDGNRLYYREGRRGPLCIVMDINTVTPFYIKYRDTLRANRVNLFITALYPTINALDITKGFSING